MTRARPAATFSLLALAALAAVAAGREAAGRGGPASPPPGTVRSDSLRDFTRKDLDGAPRSLGELRASRLVVLAWTQPGCPVSEVYAPRLGALAKEYAPKSVAFLGVAAGCEVDVAEAKRLAAKAGIAFPLVLDPDAALAQRLGVETTTAVVVLDENRRVRYRGAVDDQYGVGGRRAEPTRRWLVEALESLLAGRSPEVASTAAPGCPLDLPDAAKTAGVTWNRDVASIVHRRCATCHRPDEAAPFPLLTWADAKKRGATMRDAVTAGRMPPWGAAGETGTFANDRRLLPAERSALLAWLEGGLPEGDGPAPAPPVPPGEGGWELGKPDAVLAFPNPVRVPAEGVVPYRFVEVPTDFPEDRWVRASEVRPGAPQVVHHVLVAFAPEGGRGRAAAFAPQRGFFAAMVPGGRALVYPEGTGKRLPKGATLLFQMHYTPNGVAADDTTSIGLWFLKEPPAREVHTAGAVNVALRIPPGAADWEVPAGLPVPRAVRLLSFMPHMHLRGKSFRYSAVEPGKPERTLLEVPRYDFNWQTPYRLATPIPLAQGTVFKATGVFDNSEANPYNPDPKAEVRWGEQTWEEMMIGYVDYVWDAADPPAPK